MGASMRVIAFTLLMVGITISSVNAHTQIVHQHLTREAFVLL